MLLSGKISYTVSSDSLSAFAKIENTVIFMLNALERKLHSLDTQSTALKYLIKIAAEKIYAVKRNHKMCVRLFHSLYKYDTLHRIYFYAYTHIDTVININSIYHILLINACTSKMVKSL